MELVQGVFKGAFPGFGFFQVKGVFYFLINTQKGIRVGLGVIVNHAALSALGDIAVLGEIVTGAAIVFRVHFQ